MAHLINSNYGINQGPQDDYQANRTDPSSQVNLNLYPHGQEADLHRTQWDRANYAPPPIIPANQPLADGQPIQTDTSEYDSWCSAPENALIFFLTEALSNVWSLGAWNAANGSGRPISFEFVPYLPRPYRERSKFKEGKNNEQNKSKRNHYNVAQKECRLLTVKIKVLSALYDYILGCCQNIPEIENITRVVDEARLKAMDEQLIPDLEEKYERYTENCKRCNRKPQQLERFRFDQNSKEFSIRAAKDIECCKWAIFSIFHLIEQLPDCRQQLADIWRSDSIPFNQLLQATKQALGKPGGNFKSSSNSFWKFRDDIANKRAPSQLDACSTSTAKEHTDKTKKPRRAPPPVVQDYSQPQTVPSVSVTEQANILVSDRASAIVEYFIFYVWKEQIRTEIGDSWRRGYEPTEHVADPTDRNVWIDIKSLTENIGQHDSVGSFLNNFLCSYPQFGQECTYYLNTRYFHDMIGAAHNSTVMPPVVHSASTIHTTWRFSWPKEGTSVSQVFEDLKILLWYNAGKFCTSCQQNVDYDGDQYVVIPDDLKYFIAVPRNPRTNIPHLQKEEKFFDYKWSLEAVFIWRDNAHYLLLKGQDHNPLHIMEGDQVVCLVYKKTASASAAARSSYSAAI